MIGGLNVRCSANVRNVLLGVSATSIVMAFLEEKKEQRLLIELLSKKKD